jgi:hypothetical protein
MTVRVRIASVYGRELIYRVDDAAKLFATLVGRKTLDRSHLDTIRALGFEIELVAPTL